MRAKKLYGMLLMCVILINLVGVTAQATEIHNEIMTLETLNSENLDMFNVTLWNNMVRATGGIDVTVKANGVVVMDESFPLAVNEVVTFNCTYTPKSASVDFGVIAPDGLFYSLNATDGSINKGIRVNKRGEYTMAIRNNSSYEVDVVGYVNY